MVPEMADARAEQKAHTRAGQTVVLRAVALDGGMVDMMALN